MEERKKECSHNQMNRFMRYVEHAHWMESMAAKGHEQTQCGKCGLWLFYNEFEEAKPYQPTNQTRTQRT